MIRERVLLAWAAVDRVDTLAEQCIMDELAGLVDSAGGEVTVRFVQYRNGIDPRWVLGQGKLEEIKSYLVDHPVDLVVFHNDLTGSQQRNIEDFLGTRVIDRTRLILDVFALRARSQEGKLQVELAQLLYMLPRLTGKGIALSRLGGGIGTRGPGETKLETDRRVIKKKIHALRDKLDSVSKVRQIHRSWRRNSIVPLIALVGYTSAGKSTLFSRLCATETIISPMLFSTLDPLIRRLDLGAHLPGCHALVSDTVGFIREMPKEVKSAFKATLEEITEADVILVVLDISHPDHLQHRLAVTELLDEIRTGDQKVWFAYNKVDLLEDCISVPGDGYRMSALTGEGVSEFSGAFFRYWISGKKRYLLKLDQAGKRTAEKLEEWTMVLRKWHEGPRLHLDLVADPVAMSSFVHRTGIHAEELSLET